MQKKFKEYRMFIFCFILFITFVIYAFISFIQKHIPQAIGAMLLSSIALLLLVARYKIILFDDMMIIYEWKVLAMLPSVVEYKDIHAMNKKSKHHVMIEHQRVSHVYVFDADEFMKAYEEMKVMSHENS